MKYIHWAGIRIEPGCPYWEIWEYYRYLNVSKPLQAIIKFKIKFNRVAYLSLITNRINKFLWLSSMEQCLFIKAIIILHFIRLRKSHFQFKNKKWVNFLIKLAQLTNDFSDGDIASVSKIVWAVTAASRCTLGEVTCVDQALAIKILLVQFNQSIHVHIGVMKNAQGQLRTRAWVESPQGKIVIDGCLADILGYITFPPLNIDDLLKLEE